MFSPMGSRFFQVPRPHPSGERSFCSFQANIFGSSLFSFLSKRFFTAVAGNKPPPAAEGVHSQVAVIVAKPAAHCFGGVCKVFQFLQRHHRRPVKAELLRIKCRAVRAHQPGNRWTNYVLRPISSSKLLRIASFKKVPPCTTILVPRSSLETARITL